MSEHPLQQGSQYYHPDTIYNSGHQQQQQQQQRLPQGLNALPDLSAAELYDLQRAQPEQVGSRDTFRTRQLLQSHNLLDQSGVAPYQQGLINQLESSIGAQDGAKLPWVELQQLQEQEPNQPLPPFSAQMHPAQLHAFTKGKAQISSLGLHKNQSDSLLVQSSLASRSSLGSLDQQSINRHLQQHINGKIGHGLPKIPLETEKYADLPGFNEVRLPEHEAGTASPINHMKLVEDSLERQDKSSEQEGKSSQKGEKQRRDKVGKLIDQLRNVVAPTQQSAKTHYAYGPDQRPKYAVLMDSINLVQELRSQVNALQSFLSDYRGMESLRGDQAVFSEQERMMRKKGQQLLEQLGMQPSTTSNINSALQAIYDVHKKDFESSGKPLPQGPDHNTPPINPDLLPTIQVVAEGQVIQISILAAQSEDILIDVVMAMQHANLEVKRGNVESHVLQGGPVRTLVFLSLKASPTKVIPLSGGMSFTQYVAEGIQQALFRGIGRQICTQDLFANIQQ